MKGLRLLHTEADISTAGNRLMDNSTDIPAVKPESPASSATWRTGVRLFAILAIFLTGAFILTVTTSQTDYIEYWCSGKLLLHHANPYSPSGVMALERAQGFQDSRPIIMLNPPWALFLIAPLGLVGLRTGLFLWTVATAGCVVASTWLLRIRAGDRAMAYVFAPAVATVIMGQSSTFLLLGFCLFLYFYRNRPFFAGASLLLMAIKPHLFLVFWFVLLVDCIYRRCYSLLAGGLAALAASTLFSVYFDPHIWTHYITMFRGYKIQQSFLPTASMLFRMMIDVRAFWLLFVPSVCATAWGIWYYLRRKHVWNWRVHGMLLMIITVLASPYGYFTDEVVLLPSILYALTLRGRSKYSAWALLVVNTIALAVVLGTHAVLDSRAYMWTPVTWLAWFLYATRGFEPETSPDSQIDLPNATPADHAY